MAVQDGCASGSALAKIFARVEDLSGLIRLSSHCVEQYRARFNPSYNSTQAHRELYERIINSGIFVTEKPRWILSTNTSAVGWIVIDDDVALPVREDKTRARDLVAVTTLYRLQ